jgi:L-rhamnose isomerase
MEDARMLPAGAVWEEFCRRSDTAGDLKWLDQVKAYESEVLAHR